MAATRVELPPLGPMRLKMEENPQQFTDKIAAHERFHRFEASVPRAI